MVKPGASSSNIQKLKNIYIKSSLYTAVKIFNTLPLKLKTHDYKNENEIRKLKASQNSKAETPEKLPAIEGSEEDEEDETLSERLWGLTEMFPDSVRNVSYTVATGVSSAVKNSYYYSRQAAWILSTSTIFLFAPVMFEVERANAQEALRRDQQQVLLGPSGSR